MSFIIGVDIGGTKIALGIVKEDGNVIEKNVIATNTTIAPEQMIDQICQEIDSLLTKSSLSINEIQGIGIGAPGPLAQEEGEIICPPNLPNWRNIKIVNQIKQYFNCPVYLENDANAATLAEKWVGAAKVNNNFIYMTISTGIGAGLYLNGKLFSGSSGSAGEIGHMVVDPSYGQCKCGQRGCFEYVASGTAIARLGSEKINKDLSTKEVFELYSAGNEQIIPIVEDVFKNIGSSCVTLINIFDPEKIVIGGGVSKVGEPLFNSVRDYVKKYALSPMGRETKIVPSGLGQDTGIIGAAALVVSQK